jgi:hypothetical protein
MPAAEGTAGCPSSLARPCGCRCWFSGPGPGVERPVGGSPALHWIRHFSPAAAAASLLICMGLSVRRIARCRESSFERESNAGA